jgi:hypothetical protein
MFLNFKPITISEFKFVYNLELYCENLNHTKANLYKSGILKPAPFACLSALPGVHGAPGGLASLRWECSALGAQACIWSFQKSPHVCY